MQAFGFLVALVAFLLTLAAEFVMAQRLVKHRTDIDQGRGSGGVGPGSPNSTCHRRGTMIPRGDENSGCFTDLLLCGEHSY